MDAIQPDAAAGWIENTSQGMPFYFKDLRDGKFIIFRAYLESITENLSPQWSSETYVGKSEPVYLYGHSERDISFTLKLFANTRVELDSIYTKLNHLTSFAYPEYASDMDMGGKARMKPPLVKMRIGELFGNSKNDGLLGFVKSLTYSYPDNSPWETVNGFRVPKHITAAVTYQVIHRATPQMNTDFYGATTSMQTIEKLAGTKTDASDG